MPSYLFGSHVYSPEHESWQRTCRTTGVGSAAGSDAGAEDGRGALTQALCGAFRMRNDDVDTRLPAYAGPAFYGFAHRAHPFGTACGSPAYA